MGSSVRRYDDPNAPYERCRGLISASELVSIYESIVQATGRQGFGMVLKVVPTLVVIKYILLFSSVSQECVSKPRRHNDRLSTSKSRWPSAAYPQRNREAHSGLPNTICEFNLADLKKFNKQHIKPFIAGIISYSSILP